MRILVCGDREWTDLELIVERLSREPAGTVIIEGECRGADRLARQAAEHLGFEVVPFPANWDEHGRAAGPIRNKQMIVEGKPDRVIAFHPDLTKSKGTLNMIKQAKRYGIDTEIVRGRK